MHKKSIRSQLHIVQYQRIEGIGTNLLRFNPESLSGLGMTANDVKVVADDLDREMAEQMSLLQI